MVTENIYTFRNATQGLIISKSTKEFAHSPSSDVAGYIQRVAKRG